MTTLDAHLADAYAEPENDEREAYRIGHKGNPAAEAAWAARKLRYHQAKIAEARALADAEKAHIDDWLAAETARHQPDADYFEGLLVRWWQSEIAAQLDDADGDWSKVRTKSRHLPAGEVAARKTPDSLVVTDSEAFLGWLKANRPELVETVEKPKISEGKRLMTVGPREPDETEPWAEVASLVDPVTGETVPGVTVRSVVKFVATVTP